MGSIKIGSRNLKRFIVPNHTKLPWEEECWKAYSKDTIIWNKEKNINNLWYEYNLASFSSPYIDTVVNYTPPHTGVQMVFPEPTDWESKCYVSGNSIIRWHSRNIPNAFMTKIKTWYNTHYISAFPELFKNCGSSLTGSITLKLKGSFLFADQAFTGSNVEQITLQAYDNTGFLISSLHDICKEATEVTDFKVLNSSGNNYCGITGQDLSGAFIHTKIVTLRGIIDYGTTRNWHNGEYANTGGCTDIRWFVQNCSRLFEIEMSYNASIREDNQNTIVIYSGQQAFEGCSSLRIINPTLDFRYLIPQYGGSNSDIYLMFEGCNDLTDVRIKNLNHGDWDLSGTNSWTDLSNLDEASTRYIVENLYNLKQGGSPDQMDTPTTTSATLTLNSRWNSSAYDSWLSEAIRDSIRETKGWTINFDN